ncbi:hypothetical protein [Streptomyces jumonjinensis]|uniref:Uncharacterized protein n=1 Tax=Streptomyces jumonjinensis TaxID=1945 RepID=A0A646KRT5_STRJU|nr:hypothetical protein [Streptomyces jumonjinensis]MQT05049.1 hypothetical protein [Streptomyces jumonjinensis]
MSAPRGPGSGENAAHQRVLAGPRGRHGRASRTAAGSAAAPAAARQVGLARRVDVREDIATLTVPTLVVVTTADAMVPPALQRQLAAAIGDDRGAAVFGTFTLRSVRLGKAATSPFAVLSRVHDGRIAYMQYMEDTFATALTFRSGGAWTIEADPDTDERIEV